MLQIYHTIVPNKNFYDVFFIYQFNKILKESLHIILELWFRS